MLALQNDFQGILQSMGGTHWATEADVARLAASLRVGFFFFCIDRGNGGCLYSTPTGAPASNYAFWVSLHYELNSEDKKG
eukprot:3286585-Karenia_brevis.AAC.1